MEALSKAKLYLDTVKHLKPSQVFYRVWRKAGGKTCLKAGYTPAPDVSRMDIGRVPTLPELDFDPAFLARFDINAILDDRVELLHHEERVDWESCWHEELSTPLWRFNLHYFEYLLPLAKAYLDTDEGIFLNKAKSIVLAWIGSCPESKGGIAWDSYVISMRIVNWLAFYSEVADALERDEGFVSRLNESLAEQYVHLSQHLEKDLLANHYLENLKALVILSCYFDDEKTLEIALGKLYGQVDEQILPDGMHFELSPMYHKIVLEDLMRVSVALDASGHGGLELHDDLRLRDMCDCLYSLERNTNRTPLFNDSGDNVAKSRDALLGCARSRFDIEPEFRPSFPDAGYYVLERETDTGFVKVVFDAGNPGPEYAMGHAHCDALSFECYIGGEPWIVNCGTYAYQGKQRLEYKHTLSHSTVCPEGEEQHECWAPFRVARYSVATAETADSTSACGVLAQWGEKPRLFREITVGENAVRVVDRSEPPLVIKNVFIFSYGVPNIEGPRIAVDYAPEFGALRSATKVLNESDGSLETVLRFPTERK